MSERKGFCEISGSYKGVQENLSCDVLILVYIYIYIYICVCVCVGIYIYIYIYRVQQKNLTIFKLQ